VCIKCVPSGTPAATGNVTHVVKVTASATNQTPWTWGGSNSHQEAAGQTWYLLPHFAGVFAGEGNAACPCPTGGALSALYVDCEVAPGGSETITVTLRVNGADSALTAQVSGSGKTAHDLSHSVTINAGDRVCWKVVASGGA